METKLFIKRKKRTNGKTWKEDVLYGIKGVEPHGHITSSGAVVLYHREMNGNVAINKNELGEEMGKNEI